MDQLNQVLQDALLAVIMAAISAITIYLRAWAAAHTTTEQRAQILSIASSAVAAAEETGALKVGAEKKAEALATAQNMLDTHGIHIDAAYLDAQIEAAVLKELHKPDMATIVVPTVVPVPITEPAAP